MSRFTEETSDTVPSVIMNDNPEDNEEEEEDEEDEDEEDDDDEELSYYESGSSRGDSWISSFCSVLGHEYFAEIPEDFIEDEFNLTGLSAMVPYYKEALEMILDLEPEDDATKAQNMPLIESSAELLYGLIHARYILSRPGLESMAEKYDMLHFSTCPRYFCRGTPLLPLGRSDIPGHETVKLYCPTCCDVYVPPNSRYQKIDGAFFGTSFPGLFLKTFNSVQQQLDLKPKDKYEMRIFGFKVSERSKSGPRMAWLRTFPNNVSELESFKSENSTTTTTTTGSSIASSGNKNSNSSGQTSRLRIDENKRSQQRLAH